ncbi:MAG: TetR/AcrR family transcriptional regulator [Actinobacteria bacterium]|nr:TetR/AcrR family transcriptional regulator [Actinomycetota bacterium]
MASTNPDTEALEAVAALTRLPETGLGGRRKRRPERHDEILSAAVEQFHAKGYHGTSVEDIADAVGVSAPAVYRHFHNKQEILDTAALWMGDQLAEQLFAIDESLLARERLEQIVDDLVRTSQTYSTFVGVLTRELHSLSLEARKLSMERRHAYVDGCVATLLEVLPNLSKQEAELRIHLMINLVCSITTYHDGNRKRIATTVKASAMAALLVD